MDMTVMMHKCDIQRQTDKQLELTLHTKYYTAPRNKKTSSSAVAKRPRDVRVCQ